MSFNKIGADNLYMLKWRTSKSDKANAALYTSQFLHELFSIDCAEKRKEYIDAHLDDRDKILEQVSIIIYPYAFDFRVFIGKNDTVDNDAVANESMIVNDDYHKEEKIDKDSSIAMRQSKSRDKYNAEAMMKAVNSALKHFRLLEQKTGIYLDNREMPIHSFVYYVANLYIDISKGFAKAEYYGEDAPKTALKLMKKVNELRGTCDHEEDRSIDLGTAIEMVVSAGNYRKDTIEELKGLLLYYDMNTIQEDDEKEDYLFINGRNIFDEYGDNGKDYFDDTFKKALIQLAAELETMKASRRHWTMLGITGRILKKLKYKKAENKETYLPINTKPACDEESYATLFPYKKILENNLFEYGFIEYILNDCQQYPFRTYNGVSYNTFKEGKSIQQRFIAEYEGCSAANVSKRLNACGFSIE